MTPRETAAAILNLHFSVRIYDMSALMDHAHDLYTRSGGDPDYVLTPTEAVWEAIRSGDPLDHYGIEIMECP